jgi:hypothetical protein
MGDENITLPFITIITDLAKMTSRVHRKKNVSKKRRNSLKNGKNGGEVILKMTSP